MSDLLHFINCGLSSVGERQTEDLEALCSIHRARISIYFFESFFRLSLFVDSYVPFNSNDHKSLYCLNLLLNTGKKCLYNLLFSFYQVVKMLKSSQSRVE